MMVGSLISLHYVACTLVINVPNPEILDALIPKLPRVAIDLDALIP